MVGVPTKALEEAVSSDFLQIEGDVFRVVKKGRKKALEPVHVKVGVNPLNLITAAAAGLAGGLAATVAWHGVTLPGPTGPIQIFPGFKETALGSDLNAWYERFMRDRAIKASRKDALALIGQFKEGEFQADPNLFSDDPCIQSKALFDAESRRIFRDDIRASAKRAGCAWAQ